MGHGVAWGGQRGLDEARKAPFDVVVPDLGMPGIDGVALLGAIKSERPATVIMMLSSHAGANVLGELPGLYRSCVSPAPPRPCATRSRRSIACVDSLEAPSELGATLVPLKLKNS